VRNPVRILPAQYLQGVAEPTSVRAAPGRPRSPLAYLFLAWVLLVAVRGVGRVAVRPAPGPPSWQTLRLDPNRASRAELALLPGLGPERAGALVLHRVRHGRFRSIDDLMRVDGFGPATVERLRPYLVLSADPRRGAAR
jgi:competence ComEA-like helix-hairpin-helix protein